MSRSAAQSATAATTATAARPHRPLRSLLAATLLAEGRTVELPATGNSMRPLFVPGERIRVRPARAADARPGDIVVVLVRDHGLVAHRLLWASATHVHLRGDHCTRADPPWPIASVVGIAEVPPSPRALWAAVRALFRW